MVIPPSSRAAGCTASIRSAGVAQFRARDWAEVSSCPAAISLRFGGASVRDILSQGGDRAPGPRRGRLAVAAVLAVLLAVVVVLHLPRYRPSAAPRPRAASASPPAGPAEPDGIIGHNLPWDASLRLPVTGQQPAWLSPATGRTQPIGGLPRDRSGYLFSRVGGGWTVRPDTGARPGCGNCAGPPAQVYFLADRAPSVTRIGVADDVAPGATVGSLWLTSYPPGADMSTAAGTAQQVSDSGTPLGPQLRLPAGYAIDRATGHGLLLAPAVPRPGAADLLWDPGSRRISRTFAGVIAASAREIAWAPRCAPRCRVHVLDLSTGRDTMVTLPGGNSVARGAFSPDGGFLALQVSLSPNADSGAGPTQLEVTPAGGGRLTTVPGSAVSSDALDGFGWPGGGDSLVAELSFTTQVQVASWRPGGTRPAIAVIRSVRNSVSLIVG